MNEKQDQTLGQNRRDFLKSGSLATIMAMLGGVELVAQTNAVPAAEEKAGPKIKVGVIGLGPWGREILNTLARIPQADVAAICDNYPAFLKRAASAAPNAKPTADYNEILQNKDIKAVVVCTGTHQHKDIVVAALQAGKHVYCEAPIAHTVEDARAIAAAANEAGKRLIFQSGLQMRCDPQRLFMLPYIRSGAIGQFVMARAQHHKKHQWRSTSPNADREKAINWRLDKELSLGLIGEIGIHQIDQATWFFNSRPTAVSAHGSIMLWKDGRDVADTVQALYEFPNGVFMNYDATLANSFDSDYEMLYGTDAAVMMRENKAWMFKEVDSPLGGWEVYAKKETFYKETGISLVLGGSKSTGQEGAEVVPFTKTPLAFALTTWIRNSADVSAAAEDFVQSFGEDDKEGLAEHVSKIPRRAAPGALEGYQATLLAIKAKEAVQSRQRVEIKPEMYELT